MVLGVIIVVFGIFIWCLLLIGGGITALSSDKSKKPVNRAQTPPKPVRIPRAHKTTTISHTVAKKVEKKAFIKLGERLIPLESKAEETQAKKEGFTVVYQ